MQTPGPVGENDDEGYDDIRNYDDGDQDDDDDDLDDDDHDDKMIPVSLCKAMKRH